MSAPYRWIITKDNTYCELDRAHGIPSAVGVEGPGNLDPDLASNPAPFVLKDDDGETMCEGILYGEYDGLEPLDDYGMPNWGATESYVNGERI